MPKFIPGQTIKTAVTKKGRTVTFTYPKWEDVKQMTEYINELSKEDTFIGYSGEINTLQDEAKYLSSLFPKIENGDAVVVHAFINGKLAGRCDIFRNLELKKRERHIGTLGLTLKKDYRGEGLGELILKTTIEEAKKMIEGLRIIRLGVFGNNHIAQSLYKKIGFKETGRTPGGILYKGEYVDHIDMHLNVF